MPTMDQEHFDAESTLVSFVHEAMLPAPPLWAKDPFNSDQAFQCGDCGAWLAVVRPGKVQCEICPYLEHSKPPLEQEA